MAFCKTELARVALVRGVVRSGCDGINERELGEGRRENEGKFFKSYVDSDTVRVENGNHSWHVLASIFRITKPFDPFGRAMLWVSDD